MDYNWKPLFNMISTGGIIPVIGDDLSIISLSDEDIERTPKLKNHVIPEMSTKKDFRINLYCYLSVLLAEDFELELEEGEKCLNDVVLRILDIKKPNDQEVVAAISKLYNNIRNDQFFLEPFVQLVKIPAFKTYITVNFDDFLERSFRNLDVDFNKPLNLSLPSLESDRNEIVETLPKVFNMLGTIREKNFALTDEDFLEYIFFIKEKGESEFIFNQLLKSIEDKSFLLIGCSFPNWLMRFFIRIISNEPFSKKNKSKFIADDKTPTDTALTTFLEFFNVKIVNISQKKFTNSLDFVNQLSREWEKLGFNRRREPIYKEEIFLSYSRKDFHFVKRVCNEFENQGVKVFIDKIGLNVGDVHDPILKEKTIKHCDYFIPFISKNSISDNESYAKKNEWKWAIARRVINEEGMRNSFIKPYIIDETLPNDPGIPEDFKKLIIVSITDKSEIRELVSEFITKNEFTKI